MNLVTNRLFESIKTISSTKNAFIPLCRTFNANVENKLTFPDDIDVAIIGGGVFGCSVFYHLIKEGVHNIALFERGNLTCGTTWHTAGLLWRLRPSDLEIQLLNYTRKLIKALEDETGISPGWIENGGLFLASHNERLKEYQRLSTLGKFFGVKSMIVQPSDVKDIYPLLDVKSIYAALFSPGDGSVDPSGYCNALTAHGKKFGGKVFENTPVEKIHVVRDKVTGLSVKSVGSQSKFIKCGALINCCGVWGPELGKTCGITLPQTTLLHSYILTDTIFDKEGNLVIDWPANEELATRLKAKFGLVPNIRDHDRSIYVKLQGRQSLAFGGYEPNPIFAPCDLNGQSQLSKQAFNLFDLDWNVFEHNLKGSVEILPILKGDNVKIKSTICGYESFTPDHKPILGEDINVRGYYHGSGFNSSGMMLSGGCGREIAKLLARGRSDLDLFNFDIRRFNKRSLNNTQWIRERSHEAYAKNYAIVFPFDEPLAGRNLFKSSLHQVLLDRGCVYQERHGWERPGWFNVAPNDKHKSSPVKTSVLPYDYYGAYDETPKHAANPYAQALQNDYTFGFPKHFDTLLRGECDSCRMSCVAFDMSYFGKYYLTAPPTDSTSAIYRFAEWLFCSKVSPPSLMPDASRKSLTPGRSTVYTCALNANGGIEADLTVCLLDPSDLLDFEPRGAHYYLAIGGGSAQYFHTHLNRVYEEYRKSLQPPAKSSEVVRTVDLSTKMSILSIQGPKSRDILQSIVDVDLSNENFPFLSHKIATLGKDYKVRMLRVSFVGEMGWEIHMKNEDAVSIYNLIMQAGSAFGHIQNAGYRAMDILSLEKGYYHWHSEIRTEDNPLEAGLGFVCNKLKSSTPFLGKESIVRAKELEATKGWRKKIAFLTIDKQIPLFGLETIWRNGDCAGFLRRAGYSYHMGKSIGFGYIHSPSYKYCEGVLTESDTQYIDSQYLLDGSYEIESFGQRFPAKLYLKSPFDPKNKRMQGL